MQLYPPVFYLELDNFDEHYRLKTIQNPFVNSPTPLFDKYTIVMVQGNYCGHCTRLKPLYQEVANTVVSQTPDIHFATIQIDEPNTSKSISGKHLKHIMGVDIPGVPVVFKFYEGRPIQKYEGSHDVQELYQWVMSV